MKISIIYFDQAFILMSQRYEKNHLAQLYSFKKNINFANVNGQQSAVLFKC